MIPHSPVRHEEEELPLKHSPHDFSITTAGCWGPHSSNRLMANYEGTLLHGWLPPHQYIVLDKMIELHPP